MPTHNPPPPDFLNAAAERHFGLTYFFPYQRLVISNFLEGAGLFTAQANGSDTTTADAAAAPDHLTDSTDPGDSNDSFRRQIAILPTGAGKNLCSMLPGVLLEGITLILFPLLSLLSDQKRRLDEQKIHVELLSGSQSAEEREAAWRRLESEETDGELPKFLLPTPSP